MTTGTLESGAKGHVMCVDCKTQYPVSEYYDRIDDEIKSGIKCNGHIITLCPWCRPDSEPWKHGRGI